MSKGASESYYTTASAVARAAGVTPKTAIEWTQRDTFPQKVKGRGWRCLEVDAWVKDALREAAAHQSGPDKDLKRERLLKQIEKLEQDIRARKIENDESENKLMAKSDHLQALIRYCGIVTKTLESLPRDLAELCQNPNVKKIVQDKVDSVLKELDEACK